MTSQPPSVEDEDEEKVLKRRQKHEANLTAGLGYGNAKKRQLEVFWSVIWPQLCENGWSKVGPVQTVLVVHTIPCIRFSRRNLSLIRPEKPASVGRSWFAWGVSAERKKGCLLWPAFIIGVRLASRGERRPEKSTVDGRTVAHPTRVSAAWVTLHPLQKR